MDNEPEIKSLRLQVAALETEIGTLGQAFAASNTSPPKPNIPHLEWAIDQRAKIQHTLLALYEYVDSTPPGSLDIISTLFADHLIAAAFSLWRAAFLADGSRDPFSIHEGQRQFLATVVTTNAITFADDKRHQAWSVSFYLENAKQRLGAACSLSDQYLETKCHEQLLPLLRLRGSTQSKKGETNPSLTRYEWECAHRALRTLFNILAPNSTLIIDELNLPSE